MAVSRADRRQERAGRAEALFGREAAAAALDILELTEFAWHDCYGEVTPSEAVIDDIFVYSQGDLTRFAQAARLAITDWRDLRLAADDRRRAGS